MASKEGIITAIGTVVEKLPSASFLVLLENGHTINAYSCGKIKKFKISIIVGDRVKVEIPATDTTKGRIVLREGGKRKFDESSDDKEQDAADANKNKSE